jgi:hypothetical protein
VSNPPTIQLPFEAVACPAHGEVFRDRWPSGYLGFAIKMAEFALASSDELHKAAGGDASRLNAVVAEFGPLCRLVTAEQRLEAYRFGARVANDGTGTVGEESWTQSGRCVACRQQRDDLRPATYVFGGRRATVRVCLRCVAHAPCQDGAGGTR